MTAVELSIQVRPRIDIFFRIPGCQNVWLDPHVDSNSSSDIKKQTRVEFFGGWILLKLSLHFIYIQRWDFVASSQVTACEDRLRNDYSVQCVEWDVSHTWYISSTCGGYPLNCIKIGTSLPRRRHVMIRSVVSDEASATLTTGTCCRLRSQSSTWLPPIVDDRWTAPSDAGGRQSSSPPAAAEAAMQCDSKLDVGHSQQRWR